MEINKKEVVEQFQANVVEELERCTENPFLYPYLCEVRHRVNGIDTIVEWAMNMALHEGKKGNIMTIPSILSHIESSYSD